jgi:hypothetical protein
MNCPQCGFSYIKEYVKDKKQHQAFHDVFLRGVRLRPVAGEVVIYSAGDRQIVTVSPNSSLVQRKRAYRVALAGKRDTNYDFSSYDYDNDPAIMFIMRLKNRAVSFVVIEPIRRRHSLCALRWSNDTLVDIPTLKPAYGIRFLWTLSFHRRTGLAIHLIQTACSYLNHPPDKLAWSYPLSDSGRGLAMRICIDEVTIYS